MSSASSSLLLLVLCTIFVLASSSVVVSFNTTLSEDCIGGCSFNNASIWAGGVVPSGNVTVNITGIESVNGFPIIFVPEYSTCNFLGLTLESAAFWLNSNATINITSSALISTNGSVVINKDAYFVALAYTDVPTASLEIAGSFVVNNVTITGAFKANDTTKFTVTNLFFGSSNSTIDGIFMNPIDSVTIYPNTNVTFNSLLANSLIAGENVSAWFTHIFVMEHLYVPSTSVFTIFNGGVIVTGNSTGNGTINIQAITMLVFGGNDTNRVAFIGHINIAYGSSVWFNDITITSVTTDESVLIKADNVILLGNTTLYGRWLSSGLTTANDVILSGILDMDPNSTLSIQKSFTINTNASLLLENTTVVLGGAFIGDLVIPQYSTLEVTVDTASIAGNFVNNGSLLASGDHTLTVYGNATLSSQSQVQVDLTTSHDTVLMVYGGVLSVDGTLSYKMEKKPLLKSQTYKIASTVNGTVNGTFVNNTAPALAGSAIDRSLRIIYTYSTIDIAFDYKLGDVDWWMWVVLGAGVAVLLLIVVGVVIKIRASKHKYDVIGQ